MIEFQSQKWSKIRETRLKYKQWKIFIVEEKCNFCGFLFFILLQFRNDKKLMILPPPVQKMTGRHSVFSSSKMQAKLKNALQLSFATCQHSPWFLMTFQMMHKPRIRNSNLQFCPISNFNLRCNFLQSLHFTVTLWTLFKCKATSISFKLSRFSVRCLKTQEVKGFHLHAMTIFELIHW